MAKYSFEFKLNIVLEYLEGKGGYCALAKRHGVKSHNQIKDRVNAYREFGEEGSFRKRQNRYYSVQFKLDAIELYQTSEMSYCQLANVLGINRPALIASWMKQFREAGIDGLYHHKKGRSPTMSPKKEESHKKIGTINSEDRDRIKELEKQVHSLQIENAFLKELRKLRNQEVQQRHKNLSHESSLASENHSN